MISKFIKFWLPVIICMAIIFYFSCLPGSDIPSLFPLQDFVYHLVIYTILAYLFVRALKNTYKNLGSLKIIYSAVIFGIIYGMTDEFHQMFVLGRYASVIDLFIDGLGSFIGSLLYR